MFTTMLSLNDKSFRAAERGSALIYILIGIALLGALTMTFMEPSSQQTSAQGGFRTTTDIKSQVDTVRTAIQECVLSYQQGDRDINITSSGSDPGARRNFPISPNSSYFTGAAIGPTSGRLVRDIRCPGNPIGVAKNHSPIFSGTSGKFMPPAPDLFEDWQYYNGGDGVYIWTSTDKTDAFLKTALQKLDDTYSECEADIIDASGAAQNLDSDSPAQTQCAAGSTCFRVRIVTNATAVWNGDADNDEASCP